MTRQLRQLQFVVALLFLLGAGVALSAPIFDFQMPKRPEVGTDQGVAVCCSAGGNSGRRENDTHTADQFVKAFNSGDSKTIGQEWSTDSEYTDENGVDFHGRQAIEKEYAALFKEHSGRDDHRQHRLHPVSRPRHRD